MNIQVGIIMGSKSDWEFMSSVSATLDKFGVTYENRVISAHRGYSQNIAKRPGIGVSSC